MDERFFFSSSSSSSSCERGGGKEWVGGWVGWGLGGLALLVLWDGLDRPYRCLVYMNAAAVLLVVGGWVGGRKG